MKYLSGIGIGEDMPMMMDANGDYGDLHFVAELDSLLHMVDW